MDFGQIFNSKSYDPVCKYASMQVCTYIKICKYTSVQVCIYIQICKYASMQVCTTLLKPLNKKLI